MLGENALVAGLVSWRGQDRDYVDARLWSAVLRAHRRASAALCMFQLSTSVQLSIRRVRQYS